MSSLSFDTPLTHGHGIPDAKADLDHLLMQMVDAGGSDLHLTVGIAPSIRVHGALAPAPGHDSLTHEGTERLVRAILADEAWEIGRAHV